MKKLIVILAIVGVVGVASAQDWTSDSRFNPGEVANKWQFVTALTLSSPPPLPPIWGISVRINPDKEDPVRHVICFTDMIYGTLAMYAYEESGIYKVFMADPETKHYKQIYPAKEVNEPKKTDI